MTDDKADDIVVDNIKFSRIREGSTQAIKASSALDMSVSAVIINDYPP